MFQSLLVINHIKLRERLDYASGYPTGLTLPTGSSSPCAWHSRSYRLATASRGMVNAGMVLL